MNFELPEELYFYLSPPHPCSYLSDLEQTTVLADPKFPMTMDIFNSLSEVGFRRSGGIVYSPRCRTCNACLPVRIPTDAFTPNRSQRRNWKQNQDLTITIEDSTIRDEHFELYQRYIEHRHSDGEMATDDPQRFAEFFLSPWCETRFIEFRLENRLIAVAVIDLLQQGWSAVYTFFDPDYSNRGPGTFAVLSMIEQCREMGQPYLYLGYLIHQSPKMSYKGNFKPYEIYLDGHWQSDIT
ncbi:MAG: arginyltransferase [Chromatiales bacterium]|nr:arginyltransferase [Chromatiales bacterium]